MKKLLALTALVAGVALFAGCNKTEVVEETTTPDVTVTTEVVPADDNTTGDVTVNTTVEATAE